MIARVVLASDSTAVELAASTFGAGDLLLYPTSTVYGLGGDPRDKNLSDRIQALKERPQSKPHLVLTDRWGRVADWVSGLTDVHERLMRFGRVRPITVLFEAGKQAPLHLVGESGEVAIRITSHPFCSALIAKTGKPIISTSANKAGRPAPADFDHIDPDILTGIDLAINGGKSAGKASTIVAVRNGAIEIVRIGSVSAAEIVSELE